MQTTVSMSVTVSSFALATLGDETLYDCIITQSDQGRLPLLLNFTFNTFLATVVFHNVLQTAYFLSTALFTLVKFFTRPQLAMMMISKVYLLTLATLGYITQIEQILLVGHYPK
jgi:hypothetical protein